MATPVRVRARTRTVGARGTITTESETKIGGEVKKSAPVTREIESGVDHPNPGYVNVNGGITKNLGDYNSVKVGVSVSLPCFPSAKGARKTYEECSKLVDSFMDEEYKKAMAE